MLQASRGKELQNEKLLYTIFLGRKRKKTTPWPNASSACMHGSQETHAHAVADEDGHPLWSKIFEPCAEDERHHAHETILEYIQKAPDDTQWEIDKRELDEMIAAKKEFSPGQIGILYTIYRCAGGLRSHSLFFVYNVCLRVELSPHTLLRAGRFAFPSLPLSTTMVSL